MNSADEITNTKNKPHIEINIGRFVIRTVSSDSDLQLAYRLRYQVFQVEMIGHKAFEGEDQDKFDLVSEHLAVFDTKSNLMVATCRLNCSLFSKQFYSSQEFNCENLLARPEIKTEIGRVCVHQDYRKGVIIMLIWRALAEYIKKTNTKILFGCGSIQTQSADEAFLIYRYLQHKNLVRINMNIEPTFKYQSAEFQELLLNSNLIFNQEQMLLAEKLIPSLCRSYFEIGCFTPGPPAFDRDFKCIDFLTILEVTELSSQVRKKMMGTEF